MAQKIGVPHLSPDYVWKVQPNDPIHIIEKSKGGEGVAEFTSPNEAIVIKAKDQAPVIWSLKLTRCAEGAIITNADGAYHLHVLEMKSKLTRSEWAKAMKQIEGMYLSALAVARLIEITSFATTTCYIAYSEDAMSPDKSADLIMMKTFVGAPNPVSGITEWQTGSMNLPFSTTAHIRKGQRDLHRNVSFGMI